MKYWNCNLTLHAPAKINLFLHVLGRRSDGYHDLETWMQKLQLYDLITLQILPANRTVELLCSDPNIPADAGNLAARAASAFFAVSRTGEGCGVRISLEKKNSCGGRSWRREQRRRDSSSGIEHHF